MRNLRIDGGRLWDSLMEMARIGALPGGGCCRLALTDEDRAGRDLFVRWAEAAGCTVSVDRMGNIFARRAGRDDSLPPVVTGSHLDTQPHGGRFDGVYGVLAGLEVLRSLDDQGIVTEAPLEVTVWTNEEGTRFPLSMVASGVFGGKYRLEEALAIRDAGGHSLGEELERIGYAGALPCGGRPFAAFFEAHIEQGPVLEAEGKVIGIVTGAQGQRWYDASLTGQDSHAGTTPMPMRRDAVFGMARMISAVEDLVAAFAPGAVGTVGRIEVLPNSRNTVPGRVDFTIDLRHPVPERLQEMHEELYRRLPPLAARNALDLDLRDAVQVPRIRFDDSCIAAVRDAAASLGLPARELLAGAGHDAMYISRVAPAAMIFVPCAGGLSHNEAETATPADLEAGCNVLLQAMLARAGVVQPGD
ncbi:MAG: Zn-dependent hydrolase [Sneathiellaceae bacterium]